MEKKTLLQFCRYFKDGESPSSAHGSLWDYERTWIELNGSDAGKDRLAEYIGDYSSAGLSQFEAQDDTPASLKALLFNRFCYWNSGSMMQCVEPFKQWYIETYINGGD